MPKLRNQTLAGGKAVLPPDGVEVRFDEDGISENVSAETVEACCSIPYYEEHIEQKPTPPAALTASRGDAPPKTPATPAAATPPKTPVTPPAKPAKAAAAAKDKSKAKPAAETAGDFTPQSVEGETSDDTTDEASTETTESENAKSEGSETEPVKVEITTPIVDAEEAARLQAEKDAAAAANVDSSGIGDLLGDALGDAAGSNSDKTE